MALIKKGRLISMFTVLVTGGAGFIGSHVVDTFIEEGHKVVVVDNLTQGKLENINSKALFYNLDICDAALEHVFEKERPDYICHHAAQIDVRKSVADPLYDAKINILGLLNILSSSIKIGVKGVVFASSGGVVYGEPDVLPVPEDHPKGPLSPYGVSKLSSEYYLYYYNSVFGLPYIALRYANVYGPRQDPMGEAGVVAIFTNKMLRGEEPTIYGDGNQVRDYVFVGDVARANLLSLQHLDKMDFPSSIDDHAFNIGTSAGTSVNELYALLSEIIGFTKMANREEPRKGELYKIYLDIRKAREDLGFNPSVSLRDGLKATISY
ncbi:MAG TPA: NAD-dependent epimerase/dehydratase family protein, partial [Acetomicrobium sp.]|nr:NAD-dependent epimerase/dehydratase family protein [Acetomicrobium sp.]